MPDAERPPTGADFFCAGCDGPSASEGATGVTGPDGGQFGTTTDLFFSEPKSATPRSSALFWEKVGAAPFTEIELRFRMNVGTLPGVVPPSTGSLKIAELSAPALQTELSLQYARARTLGDGSTFTGYFVTGSACPNACSRIADIPITTPITLGQWIDVAMTWVASASSGSVKVTYNGVAVVQKPAFGATATKVRAELGMLPLGQAPATGLHAFDNATVTIRRQ